MEHTSRGVGYDVFKVNFHDIFQFETVVTSDPSVLEQWISNLLASTLPNWVDRLRVGLDITCNNVTPFLHPIPATIQLCHGYSCIIFQLSSSAFPRSLKNFLCHQFVDFVGLDILRKVAGFYQLYDVGGISASDIRPWDRETGLAGLVSMVFDVDYAIPSDVLGSNWMGELTKNQIMYAALDCFLAYMLYDILRQGCEPKTDPLGKLFLIGAC